MAGERQLPGLDLYGYWTLGSNGYRAQHSGNLRTLSGVVQPRAASRTTALPARAEGNDGAVYIVPEGAGSNPNEIALADFDTDDSTRIWVYLTPTEGFFFYVVDDSEFVVFDGSAWVPAIPGTAMTSIDEKSGAYSTVLADFDGSTIINANFSSAADITISAGLAATETLHVIQGGAEAVTFTADSGVTLLPSNSLTTTGQYALASIIPWGTDTYLVKGEVE